jgi:predicted aspartyl protease
MNAWLFVPLLLASATAQVTPNPSAPLPATAVAASTAAEQLAFVTTAQRMTVPVSIGDKGPYHFIIDTGAERTVISRELAGLLRLPQGPVVRLTAMTGSADSQTVIIPSISVGALDGHRIEAPSLEGANLGAPGMLGLDMLQGHALSIDFDGQTMAVTSATKRPDRFHIAPDEIVVRAKSLLGQLIVTNAYYGNQQVRVILDTGSPVSMGNLALQRRVRQLAKYSQSITLTSVTGEKITATYTAMGHIKIGDCSINALPIVFRDVPPFRRFGLEDKPAILLGMDALGLFRRVDIDFANRELRLTMPRGAMRGSIS